MKKLVFILGIALIVFSSKLFAENRSLTVNGQILDSSNNSPVSGAIVILHDSSLIATISDADGNFTILNITEGSHFMQVKVNGFQEALLQVNVSSGKDLTMNISLIRTQDFTNEPATDKDEIRGTLLNRLFFERNLSFSIMNLLDISF